MIKDIAVVLDTSSDRAGAFAVSLAAAYSAVVAALYLVSDDGAGSPVETRVIDEIRTPLGEEWRAHLLTPGGALQRGGRGSRRPAGAGDDPRCSIAGAVQNRRPRGHGKPP